MHLSRKEEGSAHASRTLSTYPLSDRDVGVFLSLLSVLPSVLNWCKGSTEGVSQDRPPFCNMHAGAAAAT